MSENEDQKKGKKELSVTETDLEVSISIAATVFEAKDELTKILYGETSGSGNSSGSGSTVSFNDSMAKTHNSKEEGVRIPTHQLNEQTKKVIKKKADKSKKEMEEKEDRDIEKN